MAHLKSPRQSEVERLFQMHPPVSLAEIWGAGVSGDRWGHEVRERKAQASSTASACQEGGWGGGDDGDGGGGA